MNFLRSVVIVMLGLIVVSALPGSYIMQSNGGGGGGSGNYSQSFTSQTSVSLTHNLNTLNIIVQCFNAANPAVEVEWNTLTVSTVNTATVTFTGSQSGYCVVNGGSGSGGASFYQTIKVAGVSQTQEPALNFAANVTCTDTPGVSTNCTPSGGGGGGVPTGGWTLVQATGGLATLDDFSSTGVSLAQEAATVPTGVAWAIAYQSIPGATYTVIATLNCGVANTTNGTTTQVCGLALYDGTKFEDIEILNQNSVAGIQAGVRQSSGLTAGGTLVAGPTVTLVGSRPTFKVQDDGTHRTWSYYSSGAFVQFFQEASGAFLTPTGVGLIDLNDSGATEVYVTNTVVQWTASTP